MTGDELIIRTATPADAAVIEDFQIRMAAETEDIELDADTVTRGVRAVFDDPTKGEYWVAESGGQIVGSLLTVSEWSDLRCRTVLWIHSVFVTPEARGKGIYKRMYGALVDRVNASSDLAGLRLFVESQNTRAQKVYEALGMDGEHYRMYEWLK